MAKNTPRPASQRTRPATKRSGAALHIAVGLIAAGAVGWAGIASVWPSAGYRVRTRFVEPTAIEIGATLGELGLTPKILTASGFSAQQTTAFAGAAASYMRSHIGAYRASQEAAHAASRDVERLGHLIQSGGAGENDVTALTTARAALTTAKSQQQAVLDAALTEGAGQVSGALMTLLNTFRVNKRAWDLPERYLGDNRDEADWVTLRDAIANDAYATRTSTEPDPEAHQILLAAQGTTNATNANSNLANLIDIKAAWAAAMSP